MKAQILTIIGLDRTGSSVGLAVKENLDMEIVGYDNQSETAKASLAVGAIDRIEKSVTKAAAQADILIITTPISQLEKILEKIGGQVADHTLILDFSDLKAAALEWARATIKHGHYIGAKPVLAAASLEDSQQGPAAASATLFKNSIFALMPAADADPEAVETAVNFGYVLGARPYFIDPPEYDNLVQGTDTLPGLLAAALFQSLQKSTAWQDMLRFAGLPFALSTLPLRRNEDIAFMVLNDKDAALRWLEEMANVLQDLRRLIHENDPAVIEAVLEELSIERDKWLLKRTENKWEEGTGPEIEPTSMMGQMFGGFGRSARKKGLIEKPVRWPGNNMAQTDIMISPTEENLEAAATHPLRILMIAPTSFFSDYGGHIRILEETRTLQALGHEVAIVTYYKGSDLPGLDIRRTWPLPWHTAYEVGSSRHKIAFDGFLTIAALREGLRFRPDIIHGHMHEGALIGHLLAKLLRVPLVFDFQGSLTAEMVDHRFLRQNGRIYQTVFRLESFINKMPQAILTSSVQARQLLEKEFAVPHSQIHPLPDCADTHRFDPDRFSMEEKASLKKKLGIPEDKVVVAYLGLLTDYQGIPHLIEAASLLKERGEPVHFLIMGYPNVRHYQQLARQAGVVQMMTFTGKVEYRAAPAYLSLGDIGVAPKMSTTEGSGKLLNYMALAQPVVAYESPVHREYLAEFGVYAPSKNVEALATAIADLAHDPNCRQTLGQQLRRRAIKEYSWEKAGEQIATLYRVLTK